MKNIFYIKDKVKIYSFNSISWLLNEDLDINKYKFRGHSKINYSLLPSAFRCTNFNEKYEIDKIYSEFPNVFNSMRKIDILTHIQHYGGKTRMLDITSNPLVAMYFACCENIEDAGEIIVFNKDKEFFRESDTVTMLSSLSFLDIEKLEDIKKYIRSIKIKNNKSVLQLEHLIRQERQGFKFKGHEGIKDLDKPVYYNADKVNERIIRQSGSFILCGIDRESTEKILNDHRKIENNSNARSIYLVSNKFNIISELNGFGINHHYLFPEFESYFKHEQI